MHRKFMVTGPASVMYGMASLPLAGACPRTGSVTTPSITDFAVALVMPRFSRYGIARSKFSAYLRVAISSDRLCSGDSLPIRNSLHLHDDLRCRSTNLADEAIEDVLRTVHRPGGVTVTVKWTSNCMPTSIRSDRVSPVVFQNSANVIPVVLHSAPAFLRLHRTRGESAGSL